MLGYLSRPNARGATVRQQNLTEKLAASILARDGVAAIWQLQVAAADAHRTGHPRSAAAILEIAEAAEEAWLDARDRLRDRLAEIVGSFSIASLPIAGRVETQAG